MGGGLRLLRVVTIVGALATGAVALWTRRDRIKRVLQSAGGVEGIVGSANKFVQCVGPAVGPVKSFASQFAQLKK